MSKHETHGFIKLENKNVKILTGYDILKQEVEEINEKFKIQVGINKRLIRTQFAHEITLLAILIIIIWSIL